MRAHIGDKALRYIIALVHHAPPQRQEVPARHARCLWVGCDDINVWPAPITYKYLKTVEMASPESHWYPLTSVARIYRQLHDLCLLQRGQTFILLLVLLTGHLHLL